ncbi:MAG: Eco57I restriction-modification methylase domain-containing protein [Candidatus Eisenbacteria sp.]|nr:Eco57I restriction-modification methylase domain-containing protein [Candidatus Eisenbacteria bacterium]
MAEDTRAKIEELVERFDRNLEAYKRPGYKEASLRREFIDPFFEALGWDLYNRQGWAEQYKEVVHEDAIKIGGATKAPDYCFRVGGVRKFFLEAKKPSVSVKDEPSAAYQLRRYGWSAKLPLSILSDFEEFAVYDCRVRPKLRDKVSTGRIQYITYNEYPDRLDEIAEVFGKAAVLQGSFDKYAEKGRKRGTQEVDAEFLKEIESWRVALARNMALRNPRLTLEELNFAVQRTIDRIIFLRMCEDRGIEDYGRLQALLNGVRTYKRLFEIFHAADDKYNSGLFDFRRDEFTPKVKVDDKVLKTIFKGLYYPECPYEFSVLGADILGHVYEQFLGKVIRLTPSHQAKVEEKPEVRKAGGVYYTPTYIVDYIVKHTVGKLCEGKTPKEITDLRILDPACGSGSFLLGAYQWLLDFHRDWYQKNLLSTIDAKGKIPAKNLRAMVPGPKPQMPIYQGPGGQWLLTTKEKKRILLANIYGVDIDSQAVEVTKLSLLLKVLEGENQDTLQRQLALWRERALPDLGNNIKCGNSLIEPDFQKQGDLGLITDEEWKRINPFDWKREFADIMKRGGFDAVIGNPPYIRIQTMREWAPVEVDLYKEGYLSAAKGNYDIYVVFVERGLALLNKQGCFGMILPHKFFTAKYGGALRSMISKGQHLAEVVHFGDQQVFAGASTYTCLLFLAKTPGQNCQFFRVDDLGQWRATGRATAGDVPLKSVDESEWNFVVGKGAEIFHRLGKAPTRLADIAEHVFQGLVTSSDPVYILEPLGLESRGRIRVASKATGKEHLLESEAVPPLCKGSLDIRRYSAGPSKRILFPYDPVATTKTGKVTLIPPSAYQKKFPLAWEYLLENRETLRGRERGKMKHSGWYGYVYPKSVTLFSKRKILVPSIAAGACYALDAEGKAYFVGSGGGGGGGYGIILKSGCAVGYEYVLGLLNSRLVDYYLKCISSRFRGGYYAYSRQYIERLPLMLPDPTSRKDQELHDRLVSLVRRMLDLHESSAGNSAPAAKAARERKIDATDKQIDQLVYELYGLTDEEIRIVEGEG